MNLAEEPQTELRVGDSRVTLLGTAHVSRSSVEAVEQLLATGAYDAVAVELCASRYQAIQDPDSLARMDLFKVMRQGKGLMVAASLALAAYQQRLADQFGVQPGAEQRAAINLARAGGYPVLLIDREIGITLKRVVRNVAWWKRLGLFAGLLASLLSREQVTEAEIERLKDGDLLETTFAEFAENREDLFQPLIDERDRYMAARLQLELGSAPMQRVLAVVGAGHLKGIARYLGESSGDPQETIEHLDRVPPASRILRTLPWAIMVLILAGFTWGFWRSPELGWTLVLDWVLINGGLSALGAAIAAAHPLTLVAAFVAAPLTSLNPTIGAGMVTGAVELFLRRPSIGDFGRLRADTTRLRGWWRNRVSRTLLVFIFSTLGSALGTYIAGFRIFERLTS